MSSCHGSRDIACAMEVQLRSVASCSDCLLFVYSLFNEEAEYIGYRSTSCSNTISSFLL